MFEDFSFNDIENMTIDELKKETGWPKPTLYSIGLVPYLSRMKSDIVGMIVGADKGEDAYYVLESCSNVKKLYIAEDNITDFAEKNLTSFENRVTVVNTKFAEDIATNFVLLGSLEAMNNIKVYYDRLQSGGLIAGVNYDKPEVKSVLSNFRNTNKVRVPIQISKNNTWFWIKA